MDIIGAYGSLTLFDPNHGLMDSFPFDWIKITPFLLLLPKIEAFFPFKTDMDSIFSGKMEEICP